MGIIYWLDLFGVLVFAVSGALSAMGKQYDIMGVFFIGFITAVGGGIIRDVMLGATPVASITDVNYPISIFLGVLLSIWLKQKIVRIKKTLTLFDAVGISVFTIIGLEKSMQYEVVLPMQIFLGVLSAVGGGLLRDVLCNNTPLIFHRDIYASACLLGGIFFMVSINFFPQWIATLLSASIIFVVRILAVRYQWSLKNFVLLEEL